VVISTSKDKEKREPLYTIGGNVSFISIAILEKSMEVPQNIKIELPYGYVAKVIKIGMSQGYVHCHVHYSSVHNIQDMEATQMSTSR
jgi:hypothetical protein